MNLSFKSLIVLISGSGLANAKIAEDHLLRRANAVPRRRTTTERTTAEDATLGFTDGTWTTRGAGFAFHVADGNVIPMEETAISCIRNDYLSQLVKDVKVDGDVANVTVYRYAPHFVCDWTESYRAGCARGMTPTVDDGGYDRDALVNFDILKQTFVEHYPFFELKGVDWDALASEARATLTSDSTDDELMEAFKFILAPLDDYHVVIRTEGPDSVAYTSHPMRIHEQFREEFERQDVIHDLETYVETQFLTWRQIVAGYMDGDGLNEESSGIVWGRFNGTKNVGYMQLQAVPEDVGPFVSELDAAFLALKDSDAIVLDVRVNPGGSDRGALFVASHFTSTPYLAFTKLVMGGDEMKVYVEPGDPAYRHHGELIVIISGSSYSAAETMTLALAQLPKVTLLGRNTGGSFTDLPRSLPNGWMFGLPNEVYTTVDGKVYEQVGIPPAIIPEAELLPLSERQAGVDSWLEVALEMAQDFSTPTPSDAVRVLMSSWVLTPLLAVSMMLAISEYCM